MSGLYAIEVANAMISGKRARFEAQAREARLHARFAEHVTFVAPEPVAAAALRPGAAAVACNCVA